MLKLPLECDKLGIYVGASQLVHVTLPFAINVVARLAVRGATDKQVSEHIKINSDEALQRWRNFVASSIAKGGRVAHTFFMGTCASMDPILMASDAILELGKPVDSCLGNTLGNDSGDCNECKLCISNEQRNDKKALYLRLHINIIKVLLLLIGFNSSIRHDCGC